MDVETKIAVMRSISEEIVTEQELRELFESKAHPIAYDGFEPSGQLHIAQGLMRAISVNKMTSTGIKFKFWVADWFAMLNNKYGGDTEKIRTVGRYFIEVWKASGMDLDKVEFIWASDFIREHERYWETMLKLSTNASVQRVLRCGQIMGRADSESNPAAQIIYPLMQATDMVHLEIDIAQLGMDQRKVNMLAREIFPKINLKPPIAVHNPMLLGLQQIKSESAGIERKIEMKMSKSKPETAIFMTDTEEDVERKIKNAYCPEGVEEDNPILGYARLIIFGKHEQMEIQRPAKFGGDITVNGYQELRELYLAKKIHPMDLKATTSRYINAMLKPVREHFERNAKAKELYETVKSYKVVR